ncbi:PREDICTED: dopamine D2-like receptor, partial [Priapulus caudatus]|uniref:Dopamine D2-like receptor n=1 Tax=Priapulus caudatus TaxID=37621 RepID=A0ABM1F7J7_PRICU
FIAVTQPIKYAKHKQSKRVPFTIVLVWAISAAIGIPIATGLNQVEGRNEQLCVFYNSDFIIYSSISSFYIPCIIMVILYYKIFKVIRERARKSADNAKRNRMSRNAGTIENTAVTLTMTKTDGATSADAVKSPGGANRVGEEPTNTGSGSQESTSGEHGHHEPTSACADDDDDDDDVDDDEHDHVVPDMVIENRRPRELHSPQSEDGVVPPNSDSGYCAPTGVEVETKFGTVTPGSPRRTFLTPPKTTQVAAHTVVKNNGTTSGKVEHKKVLPVPRNVTKFSFGKTKRSGSKKRKDKLAAKKEKKATKTLAIVLGRFV